MTVGAGFYKDTMNRFFLGRAAVGLVTTVLLGCSTLSAPLEPPIVHLTDLRLRDAQLFEQRYTLALRVQNPNARELPIDGLSYQVLLNKVELGRGASGQSVTIPPFGERVVEVDVVSNVFSLVQRVRDLASGSAGGINFSITGNVNLANRPGPVPFSFNGEIGRP